MSQTRWLERAVDALDVALLLVSAERRVVYANAAAHRIFGLEGGQLLGSGIERLVSPERRGELRNIDDVLAGGGGRKVRSALKREDGGRHDVTMVIEPCLDDDGVVSGVSVRYYDAPQSSLRPGHSTSKPPLGMQQSGEPPFPTTPFPSTPFPISNSSAPHPSAISTLGSDAPRISQSRLTPARVPNEQQRTRLTKVARNLQWLEERLSVPATVTPLDDPRERARTLLVVAEALGLAREALSAVDENEEIPAAPRIPRV